MKTIGYCVISDQVNGAPRFDTEQRADEFASHFPGARVYPVVDVKVKTVINSPRGLQILEFEEGE